MFTTPAWYEDTDEDLTPDEMNRRAAAEAKLPAALATGASVPMFPSEASLVKEPSLPALPPVPATQSAPPALPAWTSRDQLREDVKSEPKLERPKGWKGAAQRVGEIATDLFLPRLSEQIMHPKYADQMRDYNRKIDRDVNLVKMDEAAAEQQRRQATAERQQAADLASASASSARQKLYEKQTENEGKPKPRNPMAVNAPAIYDPQTGEWKENPYYQAKAGSWQQKFDAMKEQMQIMHPEWTDDQASVAAASKLQELTQSTIDRNRAGIGAANAGAENAMVRTGATAEESSRKHRDDAAESLAAKALADSEAKGEDIGAAIKNVTNPQYYGWAGGGDVLNRAAEILREKQAKRKSKAGSLLAMGKSGASGASQPSAPAKGSDSLTPDEKPPADMIQKIGVGQALRSPSGQVWEKQADGGVKRVK